MAKTDRERLLVAISAVAEVFNRGLSDVSLTLYAEAMSTWPIEAVEGSMREVVRHARFFPSPAEWSQYADEWLRLEHARQRAERRALPESGTYTPAEQEAQAAAAKAMRDDLAKKLGWR